MLASSRGVIAQVPKGAHAAVELSLSRLFPMEEINQLLNIASNFPHGDLLSTGESLLWIYRATIFHHL